MKTEPLSVPDLDTDELLARVESLDPALTPPPAIIQAFLDQGRQMICWLPVAVGLGAMLYLVLPFEPSVLCVVLVTVLPILMGCACFWWGWQRLFPRLLGFALLSVAIGFGDLAFQARMQPPMPALPTHATVLTGRVQSLEILPPRNDDEDDGHRVILADAVFETPVDAGMAPLRRTLHIRLRDDDDLLPEPGSTIRLRTMLRAPSPPSWPGGRDLQREAWFSGLAGSGYALGPVSLSGAPSRQSWLESLRETVALRANAALSDQTAAIAATLLAGEAGSIDQHTRETFSASGLAHLLAVAGLHLGLVMAAVIVTLRCGLAAIEYVALRWPCRQIAAVAGLLAGAGYVMLTGAHLPSLRALGMASIVTLAIVTGRRVLSMRSLSIVALLILLVSPISVVDVSFQMSFAAVMGLIAGYGALREPLMRLRGEGEWYRVVVSHCAALVLTSLLAGLATLPVSMAHFGALQPWFVLANLVAVPLAAVWIMPVGLLALVAMPFHAEAPFLKLMGMGIRIVQALAERVAAFPMAHQPVPAMPGWGLLLVMLGLCFLCLWKGRVCLAGLLPIAVGLASIWLAPKPDILVSPDAGLMAVRRQGVLLVGPHSSLQRRTLEDWQQALALPTAPLPSDCLSGPCRMPLGAQTVLLRVRDASDGNTLPTMMQCEGVSLFISASPARKGCPDVPSIDRFSVWRDGAYSVFAGRGLTVVSDRSWRGNRLWVPPVGWHGMPNLPLAQSE
ncbi:competence protein ComEC [Gluconobacter roseus NBRC 3990]|uniref:Competence protein ComEC n=2 Tax=Gluconobacter roseus TaxID=586239 RepID=A0A4Y3M6S8_9PROT|nr:DNA translocation competence protein ComA/ComEC/Rec2 [Gluconobacter roseus NBRC 3990]GEB04962.1 competence protein ComEC [Gluconobacter roseus NBRC 3990]GLP94492.1 competence protein ComEC [Gluconobacter roseus NBRC 3990]